jgi:hypothetical protein
LDQNPQSNVSDPDFWNSSNDARLYVNNLYQKLPDYTGFGVIANFTDDDNSDNMVGRAYNKRLNAENTLPSSGGGWAYTDWADIRNVNYFLANYSRIKDDPKNYAQYVGEAYFFRAWFYFSKLRSFGDLPWIGKPVGTSDQDIMQAPRLSRSVIVDSIVNDLDRASNLLNPKAGAEQLRIYKEVAIGLKARIALYEGTWEKYHATDEFGVKGQDGKRFLQIAADAAKQLMDAKIFSIENVGQTDGYFNLFNQLDYTSSKEVMFWRKYSFADGLTQSWARYSGGGAGRGVTKDLIDSYLCTNGKPISNNSLYKGDDSLQHVALNRDPRLAQTVYIPGRMIYTAATYPGGQARIFEFPQWGVTGDESNVTGYQLLKGHNTDYGQYDSGSPRRGTQALIYMRYGEILLIYAEAKTELGTLTQGDLDISINLLRKRVGMPDLTLGGITADPQWQFPTLTPIINEIRRERRVELGNEGFRFDDIMRWAAAERAFVNWKPKGAKWNQWASQFPKLIAGQNIPVDSKGYIEPFQKTATMSNGYKFNLKRDYLLPIPTREINLNPNLKQNPGW